MVITYKETLGVAFARIVPKCGYELGNVGHYGEFPGRESYWCRIYKPRDPDVRPFNLLWIFPIYPRRKAIASIEITFSTGAPDGMLKTCKVYGRNNLEEVGKLCQLLQEAAGKINVILASE